MMAEEVASHGMVVDQTAAPLRGQLDETQQGWLLSEKEIEKDRDINFGCVICKTKLLKWVAGFIFIGFVAIGIPIIIVKIKSKHAEPIMPPDRYTDALHAALKFFNAQKSGHLSKNNGVPWRHDSGMNDGMELTDIKGGLVGGYYDCGNNIKFHFPLAFSMTLLSWSVIEYGHKYKAVGEYDHVRDIIKWGTDYLLRTFNYSASTITKIYSQVGVARQGSTTPDDGYCWQRPEDMNYARPVQTSTSAPDLGSEVASALAAASIVLRDDTAYSKKLIAAAKTAYKFATKPGQRTPYSLGNQFIEPFYNSTGYWDEFIWGAMWMFYATGNYTYFTLAIDRSLAKNARAFSQTADLSVFSWDNKLPAVELLLARFRIFLNPGYPYEGMLSAYHSKAGLNMCSFLRQFHVFNWTKGGLIQLNHEGARPLQYIANAAFLASLYVDYMNASKVPGWFCGPYYFNLSTLRHFAFSQVNYILGANPKNMSYLVGYGHKYPRHVHHRGASIPNDTDLNSCVAAWRWRHAKNPNPNVITGAMVGGPDQFDDFSDTRENQNYTEPTLAGNAGVVAALVSLTSSSGGGIDKNTIFSFITPPGLCSPPLPAAWKP